MYAAVKGRVVVVQILVNAPGVAVNLQDKVRVVLAVLVLLSGNHNFSQLFYFIYFVCRNVILGR